MRDQPDVPAAVKRADRREPSPARDLSVIVPVLDEAPSLDELHRRLVAALEPLGRDFEIVFVDDGSRDGTPAVLAGLGDRDPRVRAVRLRRRFGKARALAEGLAEATGAVVVTMDGDLQDRPEEIPRLLARLDEGFDLVCGWRRERRDPRLKTLLSRLFNAVTGRASGLRLHDINCGLKAMRRGVIESREVRGELHRFIPVVTHWRGYAVTEVAVSHAPRTHGRSKYGRERVVRGFLDLLNIMVLTRYLARPLHLFGGLGLAVAALGGAVCTYLVAGRLMGLWWLSNRPLLLFGVLMVIVGIQLLFFGFLAEMVIHTRGDDPSDRVEDRGP